MFEKLKSAIASLTSVASLRTLSQVEVEKLLFDFELALIQSDVAQEVVEELLAKTKSEVVGLKVERSTKPQEYLRQRIRESIRSVLTKTTQIDILQSIRNKKQSGEPYIILFLGINGTGKTTTISKFAYMLRQKSFSVVMACADTHRAGAIEQLSEHAERVGVKVVSQKYGSDPAAVARDAVLHAKAHQIDVVLIDTAGRIQTSRNLMEEMAKIVRVVSPDIRIFVGDALAGNDVISQAKEFKAFTNFDAAVLTKVDADVKGGAALSIAYVTNSPIVFLGTGQTYDSLVPFDLESFVSTLMNET